MRRLFARGADRGVFSGLVIVLTTTFVVVSGVIVAVIVRQNQGDNPGGFTMSVVETSASRDALDLPEVTIRYQVDVKSDAAAAALQSAIVVQCKIQQKQFTRNRSFTGQGEVVVNTRFADGAVVIKPGEENKSIQGAFSVDCELRRDGALLDSESGDDVTIPKPTGKQFVDVTDLAGVYRVSLARTSGSETDCQLDGTRTVTALATTSTTLKISWDGLVIYTGTFDESLSFKGDIAINPGHPDYFGPAEAHFDRSASPTSLSGVIQTSEPQCTFSFTGNHEDA